MLLQINEEQSELHLGRLICYMDTANSIVRTSRKLCQQIEQDKTFNLKDFIPNRHFSFHTRYSCIIASIKKVNKSRDYWSESRREAVNTEVEKKKIKHWV